MKVIGQQSEREREAAKENKVLLDTHPFPLPFPPVFIFDYVFVQEQHGETTALNVARFWFSLLFVSMVLDCDVGGVLTAYLSNVLLTVA